MRRLLLLVLMLLACPTALADAPEVLTATTTGKLTIDATGQVVDAEVDAREFGEESAAVLLAHVRGWRFEPVIEDGQAVAVTAVMHLEVSAVHRPGEVGSELRIHKVTFVDPPAAAAAGPAQSGQLGQLGQVRQGAQGGDYGGGPTAQTSGLRPPGYPSQMGQAGLGALVTLVMRIDGDGNVDDVATERIWLLGSGAPRGGLQRTRAVNDFVAASERAARDWTFPDRRRQVIRLPVRFNPPGSLRPRWTPTVAVERELPAWARTEALGGATIADVDPDLVASSRLHLLTPLDGVLPIDGG